MLRKTYETNIVEWKEQQRIGKHLKEYRMETNIFLFKSRFEKNT